MAFSMAVQSVTGGNANDYWSVDMVPWAVNRDADRRFRQMPPTESMYLDYYAVLTTAEALELNAPHLKENGEFFPHWAEKAELLQNLLTTRTPSGLVLVRIYEWESGLDG